MLAGRAAGGGGGQACGSHRSTVSTVPPPAASAHAATADPIVPPTNVEPKAEPFAAAGAGTSGERPMERTPDIEYVPTPQNVVDKMLAVAKVGKGDVLYDLGCGDGRIVVTAAKKLGIKPFGFDLDPQRIKESKDHRTPKDREHYVYLWKTPLK